MRYYDRVADLPLVVEEYDLERREQATSGGFDRATTTFVLRGEGHVGRGEDVTYDTEDHDALAAHGDGLDLAGEYDTFDDFSTALDDVDLFPGHEPTRETGRHYRRWAVESAGLDLALRQAGTDLASVLDRSYDPVEFVVSTRLTPEDAPTAERVETWLDIDPDLGFKLDPTAAWDEELVAALADTDAVRLLDLKGLYEGTTVDTEPDPELYERVLVGFPEAVVEDAAVTDETRPVLEPHADRLSWDYPITGVESVRDRPFEPRWVNVKPSRFGTVESLLDTVAYCQDEDITLYGGGQYELGVGRSHIHAVASLFYPDAPNDVAPGAYNDPEPHADVPPSPLAPPEDPAGLDWD